MPPFHLFYPALAAGILRDPGPLGEEFGWRGFALPRLLETQTFLRANLIIGFFWAVWHLPTFFIPALPQAELSIPLFFVSTMALAIIAGWITRAAQGRLLPAILLHAVANAAARHLPTSQLTNAIAHVVIAALLLFWRPAEPLPRVTPES
jgi:membrane protease YdiL (CAAX protease family)